MWLEPVTPKTMNKMTLKEIVIGPFAVGFLGAATLVANGGLTELTAAVSALLLGVGIFAGYISQRIARFEKAHQDMQIRSARIHIDQRNRESRFGQQIANIGRYYTLTNTPFTRADRDNYRHSTKTRGNLVGMGQLSSVGINNNYRRFKLEYLNNHQLRKHSAKLIAPGLATQ